MTVIDSRLESAATAARRVLDGATVGIGGWNDERSPSAMVGELVRSGVNDLTVVSVGVAGIEALCAAGAVRRAVVAVTSESRQRPGMRQRLAAIGRFVDEIEVCEEWVLRWALYGGSLGLPRLRPLNVPGDVDPVSTIPAIRLDAAIVRMDRADDRGNVQFLGANLGLDDLLLAAAAPGGRIVQCDRLISSDDLLREGWLHTFRVDRSLVDCVVDADHRPMQPAQVSVCAAHHALPVRARHAELVSGASGLWRGAR